MGKRDEAPRPGAVRARSERRGVEAPGTEPARISEAEGSMPIEDSAGGVGYRVKLPAFEGPLDLLLHLIQQHELDILDIPIGFITEKYVEYVKLMEELNIDLASEYLVMAATLAHIKSKMLLPNPPTDQDDVLEEEADPRAELIRRLLEYQKYKEAAEQLAGRKILGRDVFARPVAGASAEGPAPLAPGEVFKLFSAFQRILERAKRTLDHEIEFERFSITDRINQLIDLLRGKRRTAFEALFDGNDSRSDLIVTFLAILEMAKVRLLRIFQAGPLEPIFVELDEDDAAVGGYDPAMGTDDPGRGELAATSPVPDGPDEGSYLGGDSATSEGTPRIVSQEGIAEPDTDETAALPEAPSAQEDEPAVAHDAAELPDGAGSRDEAAGPSVLVHADAATTRELAAMEPDGFVPIEDCLCVTPVADERGQEAISSALDVPEAESPSPQARNAGVAHDGEVARQPESEPESEPESDDSARQNPQSMESSTESDR